MTLKLPTLALLCTALILCGLTTPIDSRVSSIDQSSVGLLPRRPADKTQAISVHPQASLSHVVVKFTDVSRVRLRNGRLTSTGQGPLAAAEAALRPYLDGRFRRLFAEFSEAKLERDRELFQQRSRHELTDLNGYYRVDVTDPAAAEQLVRALNALDQVEIAYVQPLPEVAEDIDPPTPDYQANQDYLEAAPDGVDAYYANSLPGGDGSGVKIIDIEINWQTTHEDLEKALGGVIGPYPGSGSSSDHGTAVLGEMVAGGNGYGVTGICPGADVGMVSISTMSTAQALYTAIDNLQPGDLVLIELHAPGPHYNFQSRPDQLGYVCMEYWQANYDAILYAWAKGIIVMEAAGNGAEDFDDAGLYGQLFDTTYRNSHAIIIGAGYPAAHASTLQRLGFSNYGARVNLQGYGSGVYTCGYGSLFNGGGDIDQYYTASFGGTSSASPIVTGAGACLQGYYKADYGALLTSDMIRDQLVATGTPQLGDTSEHIGPRPDLQTAITTLSPPPSLYALPILIDTTLDEGTAAVTDLRLHNRSLSQAIDFTITDDDSLLKVGDWLSAAPTTGTMPAADSVLITVSLDASVIEDQVERYRGLLTVSWGPSGGTLDSLTVVPAYLTIPCADTTYAATTSDDPEGPNFRWISAKTLGTKIPFGSFYHQAGGNPLDDGSVGPRNVGFMFPFYDTTFNRLFIGVNGGLSFTDTNINVNGYFGGIDIPGAPFATFIAGFWSDLIFDTIAVPQAGIYLYNDPSYDTLVIEWYRPSNFNLASDTTINFEILLTKDGSVVCQYWDVGISGLEQSALVGLSEIGCRGLSYVNAGDIPTNVVTDSTSVRMFSTTNVWVMAGNTDGQAGIDIADLVWLVDYMFTGGPEPIPFESGDIDCSGGPIDIADLVHLVDYMFNDGPAPCYYQQ